MRVSSKGVGLLVDSTGMRLRVGCTNIDLSMGVLRMRILVG